MTKVLCLYAPAACFVFECQGELCAAGGVEARWRACLCFRCSAHGTPLGQPLLLVLKRCHWCSSYALSDAPACCASREARLRHILSLLLRLHRECQPIVRKVRFWILSISEHCETDCTVLPGGCIMPPHGREQPVCVQVQMLDTHHTGEVTFQDFCRYISMLPDAQVRLALNWSRVASPSQLHRAGLHGSSSTSVILLEGQIMAEIWSVALAVRPSSHVQKAACETAMAPHFMLDVARALCRPQSASGCCTRTCRHAWLMLPCCLAGHAQQRPLLLDGQRRLAAGRGVQVQRLL